jgi:rod shape-determining protein MreD
LRYALYVLIVVLLFVFHFLIVPYLSVAQSVPDIFLIFVVYLAIREGQLPATVAGFMIGLVLDLSGGETSMVGLAALSKSVTGFLAGYFYNEARTGHTLGTSRFVLIVAAAAFVHNLIYFIIYLQGSGIGIGDAILFHAIPGAAYTAVVSLLPMFSFSRKYS